MMEQEKAVVPLMTHALHYGSGVFEGIRIYDTPKGKAVFRLPEHMVRFKNSGKVLCMNIPYTVDQLCDATKQVVRETVPEADYIRPIAYYGANAQGKITLNPAVFPLHVAIACATMGTYLGAESMEKGARVATSSWKKYSHESTSLTAKICGNYVNSILAKLESNQRGVEESLMLNQNGTVAEGPGENMFIVRNGKIITPPIAAGILEGITKDSVLTIARDLGIEIVEREITRSEIFVCDEFFFTGTAAELTPVRSLDERMIGEGKPGPITKKLQKAFFEAARGQNKKYESWLSYVDVPGEKKAKSAAKKGKK
jgi:branched-chain amino acid aminotransferase